MRSFSQLLSFMPTFVLPALLALLPACSVSNTNHCGNLEGNATCSQRGAAAPYCNICVADNNGCVAELPDATCLATTAAPTTGTPSTQSTTSESPSSTTGDISSTTTPTTSVTGDTSTTAATDTTVAATTDLPATTTTTTGTGDTSTADTGTSIDTSTGDTEPDTIGDTGTGTTADTEPDTGGTTMIDPLCGNGMLDGDEVCDGEEKDGKTCQTIVVNKWGGGTLTCNPNCESFNDTKCCIGVGMACNILAPRCCGGLFCNLGTCAVK